MGTLFSGKTSQLGIGCRVYAEWGVVVEGGECDNDKGTLCGSRGGSQHYSSLREVSAERSMGPRATIGDFISRTCCAYSRRAY